MKNIYFLTLTNAIALTSCHQKGSQNPADSQVKESDTTAQSSSTDPANETALYACPMHPEVQGKKDSECPKCGMKLTVSVPKK